MRRYHACQAFLECPAFVPEGREEDLWAEVGQVLPGFRNDADPESPTTHAWRLYSDLARHCLGHLDLHTADQPADRLAALAWWAAERVAQAAGASIHAEEDGGGAKEQLHLLWERCVGPEADLTESMAGFAPSGASPSSFSFATRNVCGLWGARCSGQAYEAPPRPKKQFQKNMKRTWA